MTTLHAGEIGRFDEISVLTDTDILMILRSGTLLRISTQDAGLLFRNDVNIRDISSNHNALATDEIIIVDASSGNVTINLLPLSTLDKKIYTVKRIDNSGNTVTINPDGLETIDDQLTNQVVGQFTSITFVTGTTQWLII